MENHHTIQTLSDKIRKAADDYYNGRDSGITDYEYDAMVAELQMLKAEAGIVEDEAVGAAPLSGPKVIHEYPALSLAKTKDIEQFCRSFNGQSVLMWKMDGLTLQLTYDKGRLQVAATRGDGEVGQDITKAAPFISGIPQTIPYQEKLVVRGECVMSYSDFELINSALPADEQYANPRNLASGTIAAAALDPAVLQERPLAFKAFTLVYREHMPAYFSERLAFLADNGFGFVDYCVCADYLELAKTMRDWENRVPNYNYPVDGLVAADQMAAKYDDLTRYPGTGHHPDTHKGYAFKWADEAKETVLRDIEWSPSRTGLLNPVAVFDPVELEGTTVTRASLHNLSYIRGLNLYIGDTVTVYKANKIIPQLCENKTLHDADTTIGENVICPICGQPATQHTHNDTVSVVCVNNRCPAKQVGKFVHFCERDCMDIRGMSDKTVEKLVNAGYLKEFADFYKLKDHAEEIAAWDGFGEKAVANMLSAVENSRKNVRFVPFIHALGIPNIGKGQAKLLNGQYKTVKDLFAIVTKHNYEQWTPHMSDEAIAELTAIDGIGPVLALNLLTWLRTYVLTEAGATEPALTEIVNLTAELEFETPVETTTASDDRAKLSGLTFVVTGKVENFENREAIHSFIEEYGGKTAGSVSKNTSYLVNNDVTSTSGKNKKAKELGIPIISEDDLIKMVKG